MNNLEQPQEPHYWDVFPKLIRASRSPFVQRIPLSIRGLPEAPVFESSNPDVASVDEDGNVECGFVPGAAMILVWDSSERLSLRHVQVEANSTDWPSCETQTPFGKIWSRSRVRVLPVAGSNMMMRPLPRPSSASVAQVWAV